MRLEITREDKFRFFSQYAGQNIMKSKTTPRWTWRVDSTIFSSSIDDHFLELRKINQLTSEEIKVLGEIIGLDYSDIDEEFILGWKSEENTLWDDIGKIDIPYRFADYLRRIGVMAPYDGFSIEEIIRYGWAKYK